jgi:hypothetical protein
MKPLIQTTCHCVLAVGAQDDPEVKSTLFQACSMEGWLFMPCFAPLYMTIRPNKAHGKHHNTTSIKYTHAHTSLRPPAAQHSVSRWPRPAKQPPVHPHHDIAHVPPGVVPSNSKLSACRQPLQHPYTTHQRSHRVKHAVRCKTACAYACAHGQATTHVQLQAYPTSTPANQKWERRPRTTTGEAEPVCVGGHTRLENSKNPRRVVRLHHAQQQNLVR